MLKVLVCPFLDIFSGSIKQTNGVKGGDWISWKASDQNQEEETWEEESHRGLLSSSPSSSSSSSSSPPPPTWFSSHHFLPCHHVWGSWHFSTRVNFILIYIRFLAWSVICGCQSLFVVASCRFLQTLNHPEGNFSLSFRSNFPLRKFVTHYKYLIIYIYLQKQYIHRNQSGLLISTFCILNIWQQFRI